MVAVLVPLSIGLLGGILEQLDMRIWFRYQKYREEYALEGVVAALRGTAPVVAVEFARKAVFSDERPSADETDEACRAVKQSGGG